MQRKLWVIFLAAWMLLYATFALTNITIEASRIVMGVLAALVALFAFLDR